jgi:hypothetical protein
MQFLPLPPTYKDLTYLFPLWYPFLDDISKRSKEPVQDLLGAVKRGDVRIALVWGDDNKAHALIGMQYRKRGDDLIGEIVWLTGKGMKDWQHLLPELEKFLREHMHCTIIKPICRPGWSRLLKQHGYKTTHLMMEKSL